MELSDWFKGFEKGITKLSPEQRAALFSECSKNCVNGGTLSLYRKLYEDANGDMDVFFQMTNELPGVKGEVVEKGRVYYLIFLECTCNLCKKGDVTTPLLCECFVNVPVRVSFIPCKAFGKNGILISRSAIPFCKVKWIAR